MPCLRQIQRSATVTFAPHASLIATGSVSGAVDASFSTDSTLQIHSVNFASQDAELPQAGGSVAVTESFERLTWGAVALDPARYPMGLIAGGLSDGCIGIWDPAVILKADPGSADVKGALVTKLEGHKGPVRGLDWNVNTPSQLASGASDGECLVWDLTDLQNPSSTKVGGGMGTQQSSGGSRPEVGPVVWNPRFGRILAMGLSNGTVVIWELGKEKGSKPKPVVTLRNPSGPHPVSVLTWSPIDSWTLATASDSDSSPDVQIWNLRNTVQPTSALRGHGAGVLALSWCQQDGTYLLSSAKDNRTIVWDTVDSDVVAELPRSGSWNFAAQWSPRTPGVFVTASFDGKISLYDLQTCELPDNAAAGREDFASLLSTTSTRGPRKPLRKAPAWLLRPVSVDLGFGGKLVSVVQSPVLQEGDCMPRSFMAATIEIKQVVTEQALVIASERFEAAARGDHAALLEFCTRKADACHGSDAETWSFLRIMFHEQPIMELLKLLGFEDMLPPSQHSAAAEAPDYGDLTGAMAHLGATDAAEGFAQARPPSGEEAAAAELPSRANDDFFSNLGGNDVPDVLSTLRAYGRSGPKSGAGAVDDGSPTAGAATCASGPQEDRIQRALYAKNFVLAVDIAFEAERFADALAIAALPGASHKLWERAQKKFMDVAPKPYMVIAKCILENDFQAIVSTRPLSAWKETMAIVATYANNETFATLLRKLADMLWSRGHSQPATLCWVTAGAVDEAVAAWMLAANGTTSSVDTLQALMERTVIFGVAARAKGAAPAAGELMSRYAGLLAAQGQLTTALQYLDLAPGDAASDTAVLRDRIYQAGGGIFVGSAPAPPFPFESEDVTANPSGDSAGPGSGYPTSEAGYYGGAATQPQQQQASDYQAPYAQPKANVAASFGGSSGGGSQWGAPPPAAPQPPSLSSAYGGAAHGGAFNRALHCGQPGGGSAARGFQPQQPPPPPPPHGAPPPQQQQQHQNQSQQHPSYQPTVQPAPFKPAVFTPQQPAHPGYGAAPRPPTSAPPAFVPQMSLPPSQPQPPAVTYPPEPAKKANAFAHSAAAYIAPQQQRQHHQQHQQQQQGGHGYPPSSQQQQQQQAPRPPQAFGGARQSMTAVAPAAALPYRQHGGPPGPHSQQQQPQQQQPQQGVFVPPVSPQGRGVPNGSAFNGGGGGGRSHPPPPPGAPHAYQAGYQAPPPPPAAPTGPPSTCNLSNVDTKQVPADMKGVEAGIRHLFETCSVAAPSKAREMADNSKRLGGLLWRLNVGEVSLRVADQLKNLGAALSHSDISAATAIQLKLTTEDWDECQGWLTALKRLLKLRSTLG